jgi:tRNA-dihydrouridine synthase
MNTPTDFTPASKSRPGRPRTLDHVKQREIIAVVTAGFTIERAARYVDCAPSTIRRESMRNPQFASQLRRASLSAELDPLQAVREAARKYWRAGTWLLERLDPDRFGKRNPRHITPAQVEAYISLLMDIVKETVTNPDERQSVYKKCEALQKAVSRLAWVYMDMPPRPRSRRRVIGTMSDQARQLLPEINEAIDEAMNLNAWEENRKIEAPI